MYLNSLFFFSFLLTCCSSFIPITIIKNGRNILSMKKEKEKDNKYKRVIYSYLPKTENQQLYVNYLNDEMNDIIIVNGPAGSGKTMFACLKAIHLLKNDMIDKLVITRPVVTVEEDIGFLPGDIVEKMDPWTKPIFDLFLEYYSKKELDVMIENEIIEIAPLAFMRGRTFKNSFIIADEMQNSSPNQMKMLATRIGVNTKMVITGDLKQSDIHTQNGLCDFINKINYYENKKNNSEFIKIVELDIDDIERSRIVKKVIQIYDFRENYVRNSYEEFHDKPLEMMDNDEEEKVEDVVVVEEEKVEDVVVEEEKVINEEKVEKKVKKESNDDAALIPRHLMINENNAFGFYC
jgi:phosphate starvation-inducible PhoH-like protein